MTEPKSTGSVVCTPVDMTEELIEFAKKGMLAERDIVVGCVLAYGLELAHELYANELHRRAKKGGIRVGSLIEKVRKSAERRALDLLFASLLPGAQERLSSPKESKLAEMQQVEDMCLFEKAVSSSLRLCGSQGKRDNLIHNLRSKGFAVCEDCGHLLGPEAKGTFCSWSCNRRVQRRNWIASKRATAKNQWV